MNFDVNSRTILYVRHGSHAYGLNIPTSDEDFRGICIKPKNHYYGFMHNFEQAEIMESKNNGVDSVVYSLDKFVKMATDCNPNIIEILHVADRHVIKMDEFGEELRSIRDEFLSTKAKFTFSGYAYSQMQRIKTHRSWLLNPPKAPPTRQEFGLSERTKVSKSELGAFDATIALKDIEFDLPANILTLFTREKQYQAAKTHWDAYQSWLKNRNHARAELEAKFGYDTKHGTHLCRLQRMAKEILVDHKVYVDREARGDREELLDIRYGRISYDELIEKSERLEQEINELYKTSTLRKEPNRKFLDEMLVKLTDRYLSLHG